MRAGGGISGVRCRRRSVRFSAGLLEGWGNGEGRGEEGERYEDEALFLKIVS